MRDVEVIRGHKAERNGGDLYIRATHPMNLPVPRSRQQTRGGCAFPIESLGISIFASESHGHMGQATMSLES